MSHNILERSFLALGLSNFKTDLVTVTAGSGLPPGSRVIFSLEKIKDLRGKIVSIERSDNDEFLVAIRLHSLTREQRERLEQMALENT